MQVSIDVYRPLALQTSGLTWIISDALTVRPSTGVDDAHHQEGRQHFAPFHSICLTGTMFFGDRYSTRHAIGRRRCVTWYRRSRRLGAGDCAAGSRARGVAVRGASVGLSDLNGGRCRGEEIFGFDEFTSCSRKGFHQSLENERTRKKGSKVTTKVLQYNLIYLEHSRMYLHRLLCLSKANFQ